jgi:hypothetical protein
MAPLSPRPIVRIPTVKYLLQPVYDAITRQIAGPNCPMLLITFLVNVCVNRPDSIRESAANEMMFENIHIARYGRAERNPFCK